MADRPQAKEIAREVVAQVRAFYGSTPEVLEYAESLIASAITTARTEALREAAAKVRNISDYPATINAWNMQGRVVDVIESLITKDKGPDSGGSIDPAQS